MRRMKYSLRLNSICKRKVISTLSDGRSDQVVTVQNSIHGIFYWSCGTVKTCIFNQ